MRPINKFLTIFFSLLSLFAVVSIIADGGFGDFRLRPAYFTAGFLAIIAAGHAFVFDRYGSGFWKSLGLAAGAVFLGVFAFSFLSSALIYQEIKFWIPVSQGMVTMIFLLGTVTLWTLFSGKNNLRIRHQPREILKISGLTALVAFLATAFMSSDHFLLHGSSWESFAATLRMLVIFSVLNSFAAGIMIYLLLQSSFWQRRIFLVALIVPLLLTGMNFFAFNRYFGNAYVKTIGLYSVCLPIVLFILALMAYRKKNLKISRLSLQFAQRDAQYLNLKRQIEPHFLFNNLNTLLSFVETQPARAAVFGQHLSDVYRHFLQNHDEEFVPLEPELTFLRNYVAINQAKFGGSFRFELRDGDHQDRYVLSLAVRELADNFFKHNRLDETEPPMLCVHCTENEIVFENDLDNRREYAQGSGLTNISKRYRLLTGLEIMIERSDKFRVSLPLLQL